MSWAMPVLEPGCIYSNNGYFIVYQVDHAEDPSDNNIHYNYLDADIVRSAIAGDPQALLKLSDYFYKRYDVTVIEQWCFEEEMELSGGELVLDLGLIQCDLFGVVRLTEEVDDG